MSSKVPSEFEELIKYFITQLKLIGEGVHNEKQRPWLDFQELKTPDGNFDIFGLRENFKRTAADNKYAQAKKNKDAEVSDVVIPKVAADFLGACERDMEMRKRSRIRMMTHAGVRDRINGKEVTGSLDKCTRKFLSALENAKKVGEE